MTWKRADGRTSSLKNMERPLVSVIIPYYEGEKFIAETLESIFRQDYENLEVIVVNDGSPEESLDVLRAFGDKIKIITQKNQGQAAARNAGIMQAKGSVIAFTDQDDLWATGSLANMLPYITGNNEEKKEYDVVRGMTEIFHTDEQGERIIEETLHSPILIGSALYKKEVFDVVGLFDSAMRVGEDFDWNIKLRASTCQEKRIPEITFLYRKHESNQSGTKDFIKNGQFASIRKKLERAQKEARK